MDFTAKLIQKCNNYPFFYVIYKECVGDDAVHFAYLSNI